MGLLNRHRLWQVAVDAVPFDLQRMDFVAHVEACLRDLAEKNQALLSEGCLLEVQVADGRLACELSVIQTFARRIVQLLKMRDPLSERVHLSKAVMAGLALSGIAGAIWRRATGSLPMSRSTPGA